MSNRFYNYTKPNGVIITDTDTFSDANSKRFGLYKDAFRALGFSLTRTSDSTILVNGTDYQLTGLDSKYTTDFGYNVYTEIEILNSDYFDTELERNCSVLFSFSDADAFNMAIDVGSGLSSLEVPLIGDPIADNDELFLDGIDRSGVTSKDRAPVEYSDDYLPPVDYITGPDGLVSKYRNPEVKFENRGVHWFGGAYASLFNETDLATSGASLTIEDDWTKIELLGTDANRAAMYETTFQHFQFLIKKGSLDYIRGYAYGNVSSTWKSWNITFSTKTVGGLTTDEYVWVTDEIVFINSSGSRPSVDATGDLTFATADAVTAGDFYIKNLLGATVDYPVPYVEDTHEATYGKYDFDWSSSDEWTIENWVNTEQATQNKYMWSTMSALGPEDNGISIIINNAGGIVLTTRFNGVYTFTPLGSVNDYTHVKTIITETSIKGYINGIETAEVTVDIPLLANITKRFLIGDDASRVSPIDGYIDDLVIKPYADESTTHYDKGLPYVLQNTTYGNDGQFILDGDGNVTAKTVTAETVYAKDTPYGVDLGSTSSNKIATQKTTTIPKNITQAYTNLVQDPTDLTTANWNAQNGTTAIASDRTINGYPLTKILCDGTLDPQIEQQNMPVTASVKHTAHVIINRGNTTGASQLFLILTGVNNSMGISWSTKAVNIVVGDSVFANWIDDDTVEIWFTTTDTSVGTLCEFRVDPPTSATNGEFIYVTACQLVDNTTTMFPFVDGSKEADEIQEAFTMPDKFTFDMIIEPKFAYDSLYYGYLFQWRIDTTHGFYIYYSGNSYGHLMWWNDGGTIQTLKPVIWDGSVLFNQKLRLTGSADLTLGTIEGSRFIISCLETKDIFEDTTWTDAPSIKTSDFPALDIGFAGTSGQADSEYEYLRFYEGLLVGDVTESSDVDVILQNQTLLFDANIDEFKETQIDAGTPTSTAIEMLAEDVKTGVAIQDGAIKARHIAPEVHSPIIDALKALNTNQWDSGAKIVATDPEAGDSFGRSVAISGDYFIVGAYGESTGGSSAGAAYIYHRTGLNTWDSGVKIVATDPEASDYFGYTVSISGDYAIVGASGESTEGSSAGAAYIYHRTGTNTWDSGVKIIATDPEADDNFGKSVSISGDYAIVGAYGEDTGGPSAGAAYIYHRTGTNTWDSGVKIVATDPESTDSFGISVAISGDYAIVGANRESTGGATAGAAYIYNRTGTNTWDSGVKIVATDPESGDYFGVSVAISGDYAIVGANGEDAGGSYAGAAYIYHRTGLNTWDSGVKLVATDPEASDYFGISVAISGDYFIVGANGEDTGGDGAGATYIFRRTGLNTWDSGVKIIATDIEADDNFGYTVSISGDYAIVGAYGEDTGGSFAGAAYAYGESFRSLVSLL